MPCCEQQGCPAQLGDAGSGMLHAAWDVLQTLEQSSLSKALSVFQRDIYTVGIFMGLFSITCVIRKLALKCKGLFSMPRAVCSA